MQWNLMRNLRLVPNPKNTVIRPRFDKKNALESQARPLSFYISHFC
jgi:hypothetical protein